MHSFATSVRVGTVTTAVLSAIVLAVAGCRSHDTFAPDAHGLAASCGSLASKDGPSRFPVRGTDVLSSVVVPATATAPQQCRVDGEINRRTGVDRQSYAIRFRLRLPITGWNGRFYMEGGGGTDGTLVDPLDVAALGYASIGTDSGHDNTANHVANAGGTASFGVDPQARVDFAYNSYDEVARTGKAVIEAFYHRTAAFSYFVGCSEGGREAVLMSQKFATYFDGIVAGDPAIHLPLGPLSGLYTTQLFAGLANRMGLKLTNGDPAIAKTFSDADLMLVRGAVLSACDNLDGLTDGIVDNLPACTSALVSAKLAEVQCNGEKADTCLTGDQIATLQKAFGGPVDSTGKQLYSDYPWDAGVSAQSGSTYSQSWRSWWLGSYASSTNNARKLVFAPAEAVIYTTPPYLPISASEALSYSLAYNFDTDPRAIYRSDGHYMQSVAQLYFTDRPDLSAFKTHGGKLMMYQGGSDSSLSMSDLLKWYNAMNRKMGGNAQDFARLYLVPGMNHCSGGPATDKFNMLPQLVDWVENGVAPDSVIAAATNPGYFNVASRTRPLCPYPKQSRYKGSGDINDAANFSCR
ncbi:tannase/feruloyl esterase family alpha/beta hydrolase [Paraburkholderia caribensis]|uniref:tannase/feruloyl esterase family alpha/beta hydrolase n=1 Tax=Paraburkholderia caribensis TaxID=75105 RepID=UPI0034D1FEF8